VGTNPRYAPMLAPVRRSQSPDLDGQPERGQRRDPTQAPQAVHDGGELTVGGHRHDRLIEAVPAGLGLQNGFVLGVERRLQTRRVEVLGLQPNQVNPGPRAAAVVHDSLTQQQFRHPMPGPHQITADILPSSDQVTGGFLRQGGHGHRDDLVQAQQFGQMHRIPGVGLSS